ncbi:hypothetical protein CYMTET_21551 [Cymbomonas tetramitiformis]|uniref:Uncharacterized protein n=1 Tax=Cymbomonas tetramitiformis TaxID=36881 RepID=A0AAE0L2S5_9CHLO|nr:hypothetical protein CYMTET_21551 [Cymbomonas tetramitiformis]
MHAAKKNEVEVLQPRLMVPWTVLLMTEYFTFNATLRPEIGDEDVAARREQMTGPAQIGDHRHSIFYIRASGH